MYLMLRTLWLALQMFIVGCATGAPVGSRSANALARYRPYSPASSPRFIPPIEEPAAATTELPRGSRERALSLARSLVGQKRVVINGRKYPDDCTGLIKGIFDQLNVEMTHEAQKGDNGVRALHRFATAHGRLFTGGRPIPGDLVFFSETYDVNRDGRVNDGLSHVGIVDSVLEDGTVTVIHKVARGVVRYRMNLLRPDEHKDATGVVLNDYLRIQGPKKREVLTGQLFTTYATVLPVEQRFAQNP